MRRKPIAGHKREAVSYGVSVRCECGWSSPTCYGPGARTEAHKLHRLHAEKHHVACCTCGVADADPNSSECAACKS